jgi:hypothetical protein
VSDGDASSNEATVTIDVVPVADEPDVMFPSAQVSVTVDSTPVTQQIGAEVGDERGNDNIQGDGSVYLDNETAELDFGELFKDAVVDVVFDVTVTGSWNFDGTGGNYDDFWEVQVNGTAEARFFYNANVVEDNEPEPTGNAQGSPNELANGANFSYGNPQSSQNSNMNFNHETETIQVELDGDGKATLQFGGSTTQTSEAVTINSATVQLNTYTYEIPITAALADLDGSEELTVVLSGVPTNDAFSSIELSDGYTLNESSPGTYTIGFPPGATDTSVLDTTLTLAVMAPVGLEPTFDLSIEATATDDGVSTSSSTITVSIDGEDVTGNIAPIALDLDQDGVEYLSLDDGVAFTDQTTGESFNTAWVDSDDGLLVFDANNSGTVDEAREFIFTEWSETAETDMEAVAEVFDSNQDGVLDAQDEQFDQFAVWQDKNSDGITDEGEMTSLGELGIESIALTYAEHSESSLQADGDILVHGESAVTWTDGSTSIAEDAAFAIQAGDLLETSDQVPLPAGEESSMDTVVKAVNPPAAEAPVEAAVDMAALEVDLMLNVNNDDDLSPTPID